MTRIGWIVVVIALLLGGVGGILVSRYWLEDPQDGRSHGSESGGLTDGNSGSKPERFVAHGMKGGPGRNVDGEVEHVMVVNEAVKSQSPDCPPCHCLPKSCPSCPDCPDAPVCPAREDLCKVHIDNHNALQEQLRKTQAKLERSLDQGPRGKYDAPTAEGRRIEAATEKNLLIEFPSWGEDLLLPEDRASEYDMTPEEQSRLEELYGSFRMDTFAKLQSLYADLVGEPRAGLDSTINALLHNIMGLSPREICQERVLFVLSALANNTPLPPLAIDAPPCEQAVRMVFNAVDQLESAVNSELTDEAVRALWSGSSSFTYSTSPPPSDEE
jgi:hypothetical protein